MIPQLAMAVADSPFFLFSQKKVGKTLPPIELVPQYVPFQAYLYGDIHPDYFMIQPLQINIEEEDDGTFVISDDIFLVYGYGRDRLKALKEYVSSFIDYFELVQRNSDQNQFDKKLLTHLQTYIQCTSPMRGYNAIQTNSD